MGIKQLYNDNLWKLPNKYEDVSIMNIVILALKVESNCALGNLCLLDNVILCTINFLNIRTSKEFVVITLKFELCGPTTE